MHVFVFSEVSRREATTKLFFGFPHDCPSKLLPLSGSGARTVWEKQERIYNMHQTSNLFPHPYLFFVNFYTYVFQKQSPGTSSSSPRKPKMAVRTWYVWTCSSVPSAAHLAVRTTLQACASRLVVLQQKFSWKVSKLILATSSFLRGLESFCDV